MNISLKIKTLLLSFVINFFNGDNYHNASKFYHIYKIWNNINLDDIDGDYIEFGIFKGKSLLHSVKTYNKMQTKKKIKFFGLDSFEGFPVENHSFYKEDNFSVDFNKVQKTFNKYENVEIHKGFFKQTLEKDKFTNKQFSFVFIDCDIYESVIDVFEYVDNKITKGGFLMMDDFTSIDKNGNSIHKAFNSKLNKDEYVYFTSYSNGQIYRKI
jgi:O-methyltransferase